MIPGSKPRRIEPEFRAKIWGSASIGPWFTPQPRAAGSGDELIGEVWFPAQDLLIKFLFTSANLSVQVHPDDVHASRHENSRGKTEMWYILRADPGARIALGFNHVVSTDQIVGAAQSGEIMELLNWIEVHPGETYFVPPGTVHAIGAGIALCEIQQNSDVTYRLYDYGRDRELHLQAAAKVLHTGFHPGKRSPHDMGDGVQLLAECRYFRTYGVLVERPQTIDPQLEVRFLVVLEGAGHVNGLTAAQGDVFEAAESREWFLEPERLRHSGSLQLLLIA